MYFCTETDPRQTQRLRSVLGIVTGVELNSATDVEPRHKYRIIVQSVGVESSRHDVHSLFFRLLQHSGVYVLRSV